MPPRKKKAPETPPATTPAPEKFCYDEDRSDWIKPSSPLAREERDRARKHRKQFALARNEIIAVLTRIWESHLMPPAGTLKTADQRMVVCIHSPAGHLWWAIDEDEIEPHFKHLERLTASHWDKSTRADQTDRLALLRSTPRMSPIPVIGATPNPPMWDDAGHAAAAVDVVVAEGEARRPGEFHKPRTKETR